MRRPLSSTLFNWTTTFLTRNTPLSQTLPCKAVRRFSHIHEGEGICKETKVVLQSLQMGLAVAEDDSPPRPLMIWDR